MCVCLSVCMCAYVYSPRYWDHRQDLPATSAGVSCSWAISTDGRVFLLLPLLVCISSYCMHLFTREHSVWLNCHGTVQSSVISLAALGPDPCCVRLNLVCSNTSSTKSRLERTLVFFVFAIDCIVHTTVLGQSD